MTHAQAAQLGGRARWAGTTPAERSAHMRHARSFVSPEACRRNGAAGFRRTAELHGRDFASRKARDWRLDNPSAPERAVIGILSDLGMVEGIDYQREFEEPFGEAGSLWLDFAWPARQRAIEVLGKIHRTPELAPDRPKRDRERLAALQAAGWDVLTLDDRALPTAAPVIATFLGLEVTA